MRLRASQFWTACALSLGAAAHARAQPEPFHIFQAEPGSVVVERRASDGTHREGFVIDEAALVQTLQKRVLEQQGLGNLAKVTAVENVPRSGTRYLSHDDSGARFTGAYSFRHRFAEPFSALEAKLDLAPLDDEGTFGLLYQLTAGLALAVVLGLYALYRMVAVQLRFAERRNNFVAAVSHELKTPLTAIRMYSEMLRDGMVENEEKRSEYYATITAETERLSRLINNVLELSRIERHERHVELLVGDMSAVAREVVESFRPHAQREGFSVSFESARALPAVRFERDALTQVIFNLLDNGLKYSSRATSREIAVRCEPAAGGGVSLIVSDRGPGVPPAQLSLIFEPFYRAQNELTRTQKGTGIGLSLVRGLVTRMHGTVQGRNLAPGFEVCVTLPAANR
ncbi:MAG TPA: HAMP domain-containing sensor histidine kinase [Polyangiales bacterium]|nr:HAMP domain-containing sensor histidine kinase [Polyangiales bacterium]